MRAVERRKRIQQAKTEHVENLSKAVAEVLNREQKALVRELRRQNLRKRLSKTDDLSKALSFNWQSWVETLSNTIRGLLQPLSNDFWNVESNYFLNRGKHLDPIDPNEVIDAYLTREGRQFEDIGTDTRDNVLERLAEWYNSDETFSELVDSLQQYFNPARASLIAKNEAVSLSSEISLKAMNQFGINSWNLDITPHPGDSRYPCSECSEYADQNPHKVGDKMPPIHVGCDDGITYGED